MAMMMTPLHQRLSAATSGERRLAARLDVFLEDDYLVWFDLPVGRRRRQPDFVILHPSRGLLVLEVKDWRVSTFRSLEKLRWYREVNGSSKAEVSPLEQARQCMFELVNQLKEDEQLCYGAGPREGKLCFPYGHGVVLPNVTRSQWNNLLSEEEQELVLPARRLICQDEMLENVDPLQFQEYLWQMFEHRFGEPLEVSQIERVRWHLYPEIRIDAPVQEKLFEEEKSPNLVKVLDLQQEQLARNLGAGHRVIHGVAGSGKTLILGYRCQQLAEALSRPILVVCFNIALASRLRCLLEAKGLKEKVSVHHFHEWCGEMVRTYGLQLEDLEDPLWERQVAAVINGVERGVVPRDQYGSIMIDEGHDFDADWLRLLTQMVDPETNSLLFLYDDAQSIYRNKRQLGFSLASVGIQAAGRTTILRINYRNSREILKFAYDFAKADFQDEKSQKGEGLIEPTSAGWQGSQPVFRVGADEVRFAGSCVRYWMKKEVPVSEIAVIYFGYHLGQAMATELRNLEVDCHWMVSGKARRQYDPMKERVSVITPQSSKGLEFQAVVVIGVGGLGESEVETRLLYVAMTRACRHLAVTSACENEYSERLREAAKLI